MHCAYVLARHAPGPPGGGPWGGISAASLLVPIGRRLLSGTATDRARAWRGGGDAWRIAVPRSAWSLSHGGWGPGLRRLGRPAGPSGSGAGQLPLTHIDYVPIPTAVTLRRAVPVDPNMPLPPAFFSQVEVAARAPVDTGNPRRTMLDIRSSVRVHLEALPPAQKVRGFAMFSRRTHWPEGLMP